MNVLYSSHAAKYIRGEPKNPHVGSFVPEHGEHDKTCVSKHGGI